MNHGRATPIPGFGVTKIETSIGLNESRHQRERREREAEKKDLNEEKKATSSPNCDLDRTRAKHLWLSGRFPNWQLGGCIVFYFLLNLWLRARSLITKHPF